MFGTVIDLSRNILRGLVLAGIVLCFSVPAYADLFPLGHTSDVSAFSEEHIQLLAPSDTGSRPALIYEGGDLFLGVGDLYEGFETPWGAVWQPQLWVFGTMRSAVQMFENAGSNSTASEWANRLDLYANVQLTGTEKFIVGIRPLDRNEPSKFSRVAFNDNRGSGQSEFNLNIRTMFFEGDLGSLFPGLDPEGIKPIDYGFSVGRQLLQFQEGIMLNDEVDSIGIVRNNIHLPGIPSLRTSVVWGWNDLGRSDAGRDNTTNMFGLFNSADMQDLSWNLDMVYVSDSVDGGDSYHLGLSSIQRIGHYNTAFRVNASSAETASAKAGTGVLYSAEVSLTPQKSDDVAYLNTFVADGNFTQVGREPVVGGPLGALGILFASPSLGNFGSELISFANDVAGFALGYQAFWNHHRTSLTLETAGRKDLSGDRFDDIAFGFEFRQRLAQRIQLQVDSHYTVQEKRGNGYGLRTEILYQF
ncbi:MAG: hypothetical protein HN472_17555 [Nitrospina sp.]|nr:hypothetical protein [Nitrospina sp.]MBT3511335.1 hypothetical protein [Nitrospina sp.]MBT3875129.1 hypothetical protein [Nitrospina sp.]MBT4047441.1 hypothetical protein [Nitrospina sp.]MBT4555992.1 hypothetical protein [Nitrospina sp.]